MKRTPMRSARRSWNRSTAMEKAAPRMMKGPLSGLLLHDLKTQMVRVSRPVPMNGK